jgi:hypothetical protein
MAGEMITAARQLENLEDAMVEDILSLSDEEIIAEVIEDGEDPVEIAARVRRLFDAALAKVRPL